MVGGLEGFGYEAGDLLVYFLYPVRVFDGL